MQFLDRCGNSFRFAVKTKFVTTMRSALEPLNRQPTYEDNFNDGGDNAKAVNLVMKVELSLNKKSVQP